MSRRNTKTKENDIERFLMNVAETAENALREYWENGRRKPPLCNGVCHTPGLIRNSHG